jgi:protein Mpv17
MHYLLFLLALCYPISGFSSITPGLTKKAFLVKHLPASRASPKPFHLSIPRGGSDSAEEDLNPIEEIENGAQNQQQPLSLLQNKQSTALTLINPLVAALQSAGGSYSNALVAYPIITKSVTAGTTFLLSDYTAQRIERKSEGEKSRHDWTRTLTSAAVGLFYFGPAAHAWYEMIFKLLPGNSLFSTLQKALLGQIIFGPAFTCVFFATSLMQGGTFSINNWLSKIRNDLPGAWLAGVGFWPLVDFVSYALVPVKFIPLFINLCSFVWTIYLSMVANRSSKK